MAEIVAGFAGPAIEVVKWVAEPIKRQLNYLCCFTSNIDSLIHKAEELDKATREVQDELDIERRHLKDAVPEVITWLDECQKMKEEKETILHEVPNVKEGCLKLGARFSLSRRAQKTINHTKELLVRKNFNPIARERPLGATQEVPLGKTYEFESRTKLEEDIVTVLRDVDVNTIGIWGMGGLGKTTMAERIGNIVRKEHVFEEVAMAVVSQQVEKSKIQVEIGGSLGLKDLKDDTSQVRVQKLHARLTGTERILLILDDVWEGLELESLGIPRDSKGCTILVTSRNRDALGDMNVEKVFEMEILSVADAWFLFKETVGTCVDDNLISKAEEVVKECGGLPIALTAVGLALKDEKDERIWDNALVQLRLNQDIRNYDRRVYNPLKLSYDLLSSKAEKSLLLLCCWFPEDARIPLEDLMYICVGLGLFEGNLNLEGARNNMRELAKRLTNRSLLLSEINWRDERCVRMHDVVRDVCRIIAKHEKNYIGGNDCAWFSSYELIGERSEFRTELGHPNLRLLMLEKEFKFDSTAFLEGIRDLLVLWINSSTLTSLQLQPLKNLQTLVLVSCRGLKTISVVGELVNLKILVCRNCFSLKELPTEIKRLNRLKLLELIDCYRLKSIGRGIISSLVGLEELKMVKSFKKWEGEDGEERKNAGLRELEALTNLTCLEIEIDDPTLVAENMHLSTKLERFDIRFGRDLHLPREVPIYDKKMSHLRLERESCLGHWIEMQLLRETEFLSLSGNGAMNVNFSQKMRWLRLSGCDDDVDASLFPASLEHMELDSLPQLQEISISSTSFQNLSSIQIRDCPRLRNLAKLSIAGGDCLSQLEKLHIERCETMEQVLLGKEEDNNSESRINSSHVKFPKLKEVTLSNLPNLDTFCQGIEGIEFPLLREIYITECPKWKSVVPSGISESRDDDYSSHLFCQSEKVSFGNLKELTTRRNPFCGHKIPVSSFNGLEILSISGYHGSRSLMSSSIATNLANLKLFFLDRCDEMVQVVKDEEKEDNSRMANINGGERKTVLFPKLEELYLSSLPILASFCELKCDVVLPSLRKLVIRSCPKMKNFSLGFLAAPNLEDFSTDFNHHHELGVNVSFDRLKILRIVGVRSTECPKFYHHKLFISLLDGLEELCLEWHPSMISLFPCSVAGKLVNLRLLEITHCGETVKVIEEEEEEEEVASGGRRTLLFPKLEKLNLTFLPKLVSFCERKSGVELPSLSKVEIYGCPNMKHFSSGPLTARNLKTIRMDRKDIGCEKDLNGVLQQRAKEKEEEEEKEKEKEKKEGGEEAQESKGEIEEERN